MSEQEVFSLREIHFLIDFAWNFDENRFGGIIFTSEQLFSAFKNHNFRLPTLFGREFNEQ